jgi:tetratricopeptide (TPR) repeat protein
MTVNRGWSDVNRRPDNPRNSTMPARNFKRIAIAAIVFVMSTYSTGAAPPPEPTGKRPVLAIADFAFAGPGTEKSKQSDLGTSLAHVLYVAMIPYDNKIRALPRGDLWNAIKTKQLPLTVDNLFDAAVLDHLKVNFVYQGKYIEFADTIMIEGSIDPWPPREGRPGPGTIRLPSITVDRASKTIFSNFEDLAANITEGIIRAASKAGTPAQFRSLLAACFRDKDKGNTPTARQFTAEIGRDLKKAFLDHPAIAMLTVESDRGECEPEFTPRQLMEKYKVNGVLTGDFNVDADTESVIVEPVFHLLETLSEGADAQKVARTSYPAGSQSRVQVVSFNIPPYASKRESYQELRARLVDRVKVFIDGLFEQRTPQIAAVQRVLDPEASSSPSRLFEDAISSLAKGDSGLATIGFQILANAPQAMVPPVIRARAHYQLAVIKNNRGDWEPAKDQLEKAVDLLRPYSPARETRMDVALPEKDYVYFDVLRLAAENAYKQKQIKGAISRYQELMNHPVLMRAIEEDKAGAMSEDNKQRFGRLPDFIEKIVDLFLVHGDIDAAETGLMRLAQTKTDLTKTKEGLVFALLRKAESQMLQRSNAEVLAIADKIERIESELPPASRTRMHHLVRREVYYSRLSDAIDRQQSWEERLPILRNIEKSLREYMDGLELESPSLLWLDLVEILTIGNRPLEADATLKRFAAALDHHASKKAMSGDELLAAGVISQFLAVVLDVVQRRPYVTSLKRFTELTKQLRRSPSFNVGWDSKILTDYFSSGSPDRKFKEDERLLVVNMMKNIAAEK